MYCYMCVCVYVFMYTYIYIFICWLFNKAMILEKAEIDLPVLLRHNVNFVYYRLLKFV